MQLAVCGNLDGDRHDINPIIADHRERTGKPTISAEGFSRFLGALLVACRNRRKPQVGKTVDRGTCDTFAQLALGVRTNVRSSTPLIWSSRGEVEQRGTTTCLFGVSSANARYLCAPVVH